MRPSDAERTIHRVFGHAPPAVFFGTFSVLFLIYGLQPFRMVADKWAYSHMWAWVVGFLDWVPLKGNDGGRGAEEFAHTHYGY